MWLVLFSGSLLLLRIYYLPDFYQNPTSFKFTFYISPKYKKYQVKFIFISLILTLLPVTYSSHHAENLQLLLALWVPLSFVRIWLAHQAFHFCNARIVKGVTQTIWVFLVLKRTLKEVAFSFSHHLMVGFLWTAVFISLMDGLFCALVLWTNCEVGVIRWEGNAMFWRLGFLRDVAGMIDGRNGVPFEQFGDVGVKLTVRAPADVNRLQMGIVRFIRWVECI